MATRWHAEAKNTVLFCIFRPNTESQAAPRARVCPMALLTDVHSGEGTAMVLGPPRSGTAATGRSTPLISACVSFLRCRVALVGPTR